MALDVKIRWEKKELKNTLSKKKYLHITRL